MLDMRGELKNTGFGTRSPSFLSMVWNKGQILTLRTLRLLRRDNQNIWIEESLKRFMVRILNPLSMDKKRAINSKVLIRQ